MAQSTEVTFGDNRSNFMDNVTFSPVLKSFFAGSISGTCSTLLFQPLDLVKTRLQSPIVLEHHSPSSGMVAIVGNVVKNNHIFGLWKGITPSMARCVPGVGLYFSSLHWLKSCVCCDGVPGPLEAVLLGATARTFSGMALIPFTVVKTRYESDIYRYKSVLEAVQMIYSKEGAKGLTCGLIPTILRDAPFSGIYLMFYTQTKNLIPQNLLDGGLGPASHFTCGILSGMLASGVTQPFDVLKTKMQIYPDQFKGLFHAAIFVYKKYGPSGYFKGLVPRMIRRTLMSAMAWTVYEQIMKTLALK